MLIPNVKFLVLPLIALAVIAFLPSPSTGESGARPAVVVAKTAGCQQPYRIANCVVAAELATGAVVR